MNRHHCNHYFEATGNAVALSDSSGSVTKHCQVLLVMMMILVIILEMMMMFLDHVVDDEDYSDDILGK